MTDWFERLRDRKASLLKEDLWRSLRTVESRSHGCSIVRIDGRDIVSFASNDYLGLANHPAVLQAARDAIDKWGGGSGASPLMSGHFAIHEELEAALCRLKGSRAALLFPSGFQAALATLNALGDASVTIILDRLAHASLIDGARGSGARMRTFLHNDCADLDRILESERGRFCTVVVESLYSMDGDTAPLGELVDLARRHRALILVDEAHATGVLGPDGRGLLSTLGETLPEHVIAMGTLSKALGSQGGFICASGEIVETVVHGRAHMFSTALAPASTGAALAALQVNAVEPERREKVSKLAGGFREHLRTRGLETPSTAGPIVPVIIGEERKALELSQRMFDAGLLVPAVRFPTVKKGHARLRVSFSADHSPDDLHLLLAAFEA